MIIYGDLIDEETRCLHYQGEKDVIALKCYACRRYYPCYHCHDKYETHAYAAYPVYLRADKVVFCGVCKEELRIADYRAGGSSCFSCHADFNPNCRLHESIYFLE